MKLSATITATELDRVASSLFPLRIDLSSPGETDRFLELDTCIDTQLEADRGLVLSARGSLHWPDRSLVDRVHIERVDILLEPELVPSTSGLALRLGLRCQDLDLAWIPDLIDAALVQTINTRIAKSTPSFRWDFSDTLSFSVESESSRSNLRAVDFEVDTAVLQVNDESIRLAGPMSMNISRETALASAAEAN